MEKNNSRTSISDYSTYRDFCKSATENDEIFKDFRRNPVYNVILDHATKEQGETFIKQMIHRGVNHEWIERFINNDDVGNPIIYFYKEWGAWSPSTLQYIKILTDILSMKIHFSRIAEIGGGYGGQCAVIKTQLPYTDYHIWDLSEPIMLTDRYLSELKITATSHSSISDEGEFDLVISNYAYSEVFKDVQDEYYEKIISKSKHGYMLYNWTPPKYDTGVYTANEFAEKVGGQIVDEAITNINNKLIIW